MRSYYLVFNRTKFIDLEDKFSRFQNLEIKYHDMPRAKNLYREFTYVFHEVKILIWKFFPNLEFWKSRGRKFEIKTSFDRDIIIWRLTVLKLYFDILKISRIKNLVVVNSRLKRLNVILGEILKSWDWLYRFRISELHSRL